MPAQTKWSPRPLLHEPAVNWNPFSNDEALVSFLEQDQDIDTALNTSHCAVVERLAAARLPVTFKRYHNHKAHFASKALRIPYRTIAWGRTCGTFQLRHPSRPDALVPRPFVEVFLDTESELWKGTREYGTAYMMPVNGVHIGLYDPWLPVVGDRPLHMIIGHEAVGQAWRVWREEAIKLSIEVFLILQRIWPTDEGDLVSVACRFGLIGNKLHLDHVFHPGSFVFLKGGSLINLEIFPDDTRETIYAKCRHMLRIVQKMGH